MKKLFSILLLATALPALADRLPIPADAPASYAEECASCHIAYPPQLLRPEDWQKLMSSLDHHFGSDATVDRKNQAEISAFLQRYAGRPERLGENAELPRISQSRWFRREHGRLAAAYWQTPPVKSPANCEGCHPNAAAGSFSEREIRLPKVSK